MTGIYRENKNDYGNTLSLLGYDFIWCLTLCATGLVWPYTVIIGENIND